MTKSVWENGVTTEQLEELVITMETENENENEVLQLIEELKSKNEVFKFVEKLELKRTLVASLRDPDGIRRPRKIRLPMKTMSVRMTVASAGQQFELPLPKKPANRAN